MPSDRLLSGRSQELDALELPFDNQCQLAACFVSDALNAFVKTAEGLERWKAVLAALSK